MEIKGQLSKFVIKHESTIIEYLNRKNINCIPQLYWFGLHDSLLTMVISYCDSPFNIEHLTINHFQQLISGLEKIHQASIIHRDIKMANIMFRRGNICFIDFGLAMIFKDDYTGEHIPNTMGDTVIGTPTFMSWNIHCGNKPSRRDDLISLGYVFIYLPQFLQQLNDTDADDINNDESIDSLNNVYLKEMKKWTSIETYQIPQQFRQYLELCYQLKYEQTPNYALLRTILSSGTSP